VKLFGVEIASDRHRRVYTYQPTVQYFVSSMRVCVMKHNLLCDLSPPSHHPPSNIQPCAHSTEFGTCTSNGLPGVHVAAHPRIFCTRRQFFGGRVLINKTKKKKKKKKRAALFSFGIRMLETCCVISPVFCPSPPRTTT
jgi:hypothetical protein